jgi:hypothetical protein
MEQKASLNECKKIQTTPWTRSDHSGIKLEIKNKRNYRKYSNTWRLNSTLVSNQWVIEEIRGINPIL